jgi:hypothetical protein
VKRLVTTFLVFAGFVAGCFAPSVPVPPPGPESMTFALALETGEASYRAALGRNWGDSWVTIYDDTTGEGVIDRSDAAGNVGPTAPWTANEGDRVRIIFERDDGQSSGVCLILRNGPSSSGQLCTF